MSTAAHVVAMLDKSHGLVLSTVKNLTPEQLTASAENLPNNFTWTFGHLALAYPFFGSTIGATLTPVPAEWKALFGQGSKPLSDPNAYPPFEVVRAALERGHAELRAAALKLPDAKFDEKSDNDGGGFVTTKADALLTCAFHFGWHFGQLVSLRTALGVGSIFA